MKEKKNTLKSKRAENIYKIPWEICKFFIIPEKFGLCYENESR